VLEIALRAAVMSKSTRAFGIQKQWAYLEFEELFSQGDMEKSEHFDISFLSDREATNIAQVRPIFVQEVIKPLFISLSEVLPQLDTLVKACQSNIEAWQKYKETVEDRDRYLVPPVQVEMVDDGKSD